MTFRTILLLLGFQAASMAPMNRSQLATPGADGAFAQTVLASVLLTDQENSGRYQWLASRKHARQEVPSQILTGLVEWEYKPLAWACDVPNCDHFALYDDATRTNYELDDARAALPYEGKRAKVTGVVNTKDSVIHVLSIEAAK